MALVVLCLLLYFLKLGTRPLWNVDEGMHAATSKEMVLTGDWITPTHNGERFYDKPAFHNWLVAASFLGLGVNEFAARLPDAVLALGTVLLTWLLGRRMYGTRTGFFGGVVLATSVLLVVLARSVMHDTSLLFTVTLALVAFYEAYASEAHRKRWLLILYVALGLATLAKGPMGLLLPGAVMFFFLALRRDLRFVARMGVWWGAPVFLLVAAPWYVAIALANDDFLYEFFVKLNFGSFAGAEVNHPQPFWYYAPALFGTFMPWSVFLPVAIGHGWRRRPNEERGASAFLLTWIVVYLVFFSIAESKLGTYILPMFPAAALLVGVAFGDVAAGREGAPRRGLLVSFAAFLIFPVGVIWFFLADPYPDLLVTYGIDVREAVAAVLVLLLGLGASFFLVRRGRATAGVLTTALGMAGFFALFALLVVPAMNERRSSRELAYEVDRILPEGMPVPCFSSMRDTILFYTDRKIEMWRKPQLPKLRRRFAGDEPFWLILDEKRYREWNVASWCPDLRILATQADDMLLWNGR